MLDRQPQRDPSSARLRLDSHRPDRWREVEGLDRHRNAVGDHARVHDEGRVRQIIRDRTPEDGDGAPASAAGPYTLENRFGPRQWPKSKLNAAEPRAGISRDAALANAPLREGVHLRVPVVLEEGR